MTTTRLEGGGWRGEEEIALELIIVDAELTCASRSPPVKTRDDRRDDGEPPHRADGIFRRRRRRRCHRGAATARVNWSEVAGSGANGSVPGAPVAMATTAAPSRWWRL